MIAHSYYPDSTNIKYMKFDTRDTPCQCPIHIYIGRKQRCHVSFLLGLAIMVQLSPVACQDRLSAV